MKDREFSKLFQLID